MRTFQRIARLIRPAVGLPLLAGLALVGLLALSLGCGQGQQAAASAPALLPWVKDVPLPAGFEIKPDQSTDRQKGEVRVVDHLYTGSTPMRQVAEFYRREMPAEGWKPVEQSYEQGRRRLIYEKGSERCYVSTWENWGTKLLIQIYPKGSTPPGTNEAAS